MKMFMAVAPETRKDELRKLMAAHGIHAYSEMAGVTGEGVAGRHFGTPTWPGKSFLVFAVVPDAKVIEMTSALKDFVKRLYPDEGARAFVLPVEEII